MATPAQTPTLAQSIKSKYPGVYDDMPDSALEEKVLQKYPQYGDMPRSQPNAGLAPAAQPNVQMQPASFAQDYSAYSPDVLDKNTQGFGVSDAARGVTGKSLGKELALEGAQGAAGLATGPLPVQAAVLGASGVAQSKLQGGSNTDAAISGGIGAALPFLGPMLGKIPRLIGADKARAAANFTEVMSKAKDVPIDTTNPGNTALKIQEFASRGGRQPKVVSDFLRRATNPAMGPITYEEARDFASNAGQLSAEERNALKPNVRRMIGQFARDLGNANAGAANEAGVLPQYQNAMSEYSRAMTVEDLKNMLKGSAVNAAKYAVPTAVGGAAAGYVAKKALGVK